MFVIQKKNLVLCTFSSLPAVEGYLVHFYRCQLCCFWRICVYLQQIAMFTDLDFVALKWILETELEAYCDGSWWDVEILKKDRDKYLVHYQNFPDQNDQWVPINHLRMRCRTSNLSDCRGVVPGMDVCVMTRHPHSDDKPPVRLTPTLVLHLFS